jgi:hypothetical protein
MPIETIFNIVNSLAPLAWLLLIVAPRWRITERLILSGTVPALFAVVYLILMVLYFSQGDGDFSSLAGVMKLFDNPGAVTAGWVHYLAFDLFVGSWIVSNSRRHALPHIMVVPCLIFTFLFGPVGMLMYLFLRWVKTKKLLHENF